MHPTSFLWDGFTSKQSVIPTWWDSVAFKSISYMGGSLMEIDNGQAPALSPWLGMWWLSGSSLYFRGTDPGSNPRAGILYKSSRSSHNILPAGWELAMLYEISNLCVVKPQSFCFCISLIIGPMLKAKTYWKEYWELDALRYLFTILLYFFLPSRIESRC